MAFFIFLYNLIFLPLSIGLFFYSLGHKLKTGRDLYFPPEVSPGCTWIHAASVGEVRAAVPLIEELKKAEPRKPIYVSTLTPAGQDTARELKGIEGTFFYPFDFPLQLFSLFSALTPERVIILETELWPNLIFWGGKKAEIYLANGRLGEGKMPLYHKFSWLYRRLLQSFSGLFLQSEEDGERISSLGVDRRTFCFPGNLKFDGVSELKPQGEDSRFLTGGSTHPGEEEILLRVYRRLKENHPELKLLLAPRHLQRLEEVKKAVEDSGMGYTLRSEGKKEKEVTVLDTMGELADMYRKSRAVFIGGSLVEKGGHNPLEALGRPLFFGPHMENWGGLAEELEKEGLALTVKGEEELYSSLEIVLSGGIEDIRVLERKARNFVKTNSGAAKKIVEEIRA